MATRTVSTDDHADAALNFLGKQQRPPMNGEEYFQRKMQEVINAALVEADTKRFNYIKELMNDKDMGGSIAKLRELLG